MSRFWLELTNVVLIIIGVGFTAWGATLPVEREERVAQMAMFVAGVGARGLGSALVDRYKDED